MPELPDVLNYIHALEAHLGGRELAGVRILNPFVLRSVHPPVSALAGRSLGRVFRIGKRIVLTFDTADAAPIFAALHLMIAGRLRWRARGRKAGLGGRLVLAVFEFAHGSLYFTEAGSRKRASLTLIDREEDLHELDRGGLDPLSATEAAFHEALLRENHTLKRALTDPRLFSGIGNAYSDEILHAARLSPLKLTRSLSAIEIDRLYAASRSTLTSWIERLRRDLGGAFPETVTAFHDDMAVHGRYRQPCPVCGSPVQRIVYADNECDYCPKCQTGGRLLADRSLSRLLRDDWPKRAPE
jgi:formamidopyrimidine-DNA glycosylase